MVDAILGDKVNWSSERLSLIRIDLGRVGFRKSLGKDA